MPSFEEVGKHGCKRDNNKKSINFNHRSNGFYEDAWLRPMQDGAFVKDVQNKRELVTDEKKVCNSFRGFMHPTGQDGA